MKEEGYTKLPNDLQKAILSNKFNGSEMAVLMCVIRLTLGYNLKERAITCESVEAMSDFCLRSVKRAFKSLKDRKVFLSKPSKNNKSIYSINFNFSEWSSSDKSVTTSSDKSVTASSDKSVTASSDKSVTASSDKSVTTSSDKSVTPSTDHIKNNSFKDNLLKTTTTQKTAAVFEKLILISGTEKREPNRHESELLEKWESDGFTDEEILTAFVKAKEQGMRDELNLSYVDKVLTAKKTKIEKPKSEPAPPPSYDLDKAERMSRTGVPKLKKKEKR